VTLPDYWIEQPELRLDRATESAVDEFVALRGTDGMLDVDALLSDWPDVARWRFLRAIADRSDVAFHGTGDPRIEEFVPRRPIDFAPFGDQEAVFATSDPIWAMFYAVVDRARYELTLNNACIELLDPAGGLDGRYYYFSVTANVLPRRPWRTGHLYLLPMGTFVEQPSATYAGYPARVPQLASPVAVKPFARLSVEPHDFPFLDRIRGHDDDRLAEYARAVMAAEPWPD
jgi:hypothetical protein